jgi:Domain of unknown function (DUF1902)
VKRTFFVKAIWDEEASVFVSESDIFGLHIETETIEEFEDVMSEIAIELIVANHFTAPEMANRPLKDLIPAILWQRPTPKLAFT